MIEKTYIIQDLYNHFYWSAADRNHFDGSWSPNIMDAEEFVKKKDALERIEKGPHPDQYDHGEESWDKHHELQGKILTIIPIYRSKEP